MINKKFQRELLKQMVSLSTAGFGLVAALAWNKAIQAFVKEYIDKYISVGSGIISRFIHFVPNYNYLKGNFWQFMCQDQRSLVFAHAAW